MKVIFSLFQLTATIRGEKFAKKEKAWVDYRQFWEFKVSLAKWMQQVTLKCRWSSDIRSVLNKEFLVVQATWALTHSKCACDAIKAHSIVCWS